MPLVLTLPSAVSIINSHSLWPIFLFCLSGDTSLLTYPHYPCRLPVNNPMGKAKRNCYRMTGIDIVLATRQCTCVCIHTYTQQTYTPKRAQPGALLSSHPTAVMKKFCSPTDRAMQQTVTIKLPWATRSVRRDLLQVED